MTKGIKRKESSGGSSSPTKQFLEIPRNGLVGGDLLPDDSCLCSALMDRLLEILGYIADTEATAYLLE
ncbi:hypothetical protein KC221_28050, partial [Mycobacterium tuberculosis]|nr:hypothetical protein [Mycobacterium tuberculosis]